ncbi:MAG: hypothetical protein M1829_002420 [Trizodia sp. TS-e1964]|nr:MAG: hypothetical protein M1829_002420 [Trizodia sp. TS-e1964]
MSGKTALKGGDHGLTGPELDQLRLRASAAKSTAYCPYSKFQVGACILTLQGVYISGANVENASFPVGICAERTAFAKAITDGHRDFKALSIATNTVPAASPCGMCRQFIGEFCNSSLPIFMFDADGDAPANVVWAEKHGEEGGGVVGPKDGMVHITADGHSSPRVFLQGSRGWGRAKGGYKGDPTSRDKGLALVVATLKLKQAKATASDALSRESLHFVFVFNLVSAVFLLPAATSRMPRAVVDMSPGTGPRRPRYIPTPPGPLLVHAKHL